MRKNEPNVADLLREITDYKEVVNDLLEFIEYHHDEEVFIRYLLKNYYDKYEIEHYFKYKPEIIEGVMEDLYENYDR